MLSQLYLKKILKFLCAKKSPRFLRFGIIRADNIRIYGLILTSSEEEVASRSDDGGGISQYTLRVTC